MLVNQKGFTLIELMIVMAIIGILAAIGSVMFTDYTVRSQVGEAPILASKLKVAVEDYYADKGIFPTQLSDIYGAGSPEANPLNHQGNYVSMMNIRSKGEIDVTLGNNVNGILNNAIYTLRPVISNSGDVSWVCGTGLVPAGSTDPGLDATTVPPKYLPSVCR